jgi:hypothetical protein
MPISTLPLSGSRWKVFVIALLSALFIIGAFNLFLTSNLLHEHRDLSRQSAFWTLCQPGYDAAARKSAFLLLVAEGNKEWRSANLDSLDLQKANLKQASLSGAAFRRAMLASVDLSAARLNKASFEMADLNNADLSRAELSEAQLYRTVLKGAKLNRTILRAANLQEVKGEGAQFLAADLGDSDCLMADFRGATLAGANLNSARLEGAIFSGANLSLARVQDANIHNADFTNCNWWRARGFTSEKLGWLQKNFSPGTNAPAELKKDFDKWLSERSGASPANTF